MSDENCRPLQLSFNEFLKVDSQGSLITSDGELLPVRELDERLGLGKLIDEYLIGHAAGREQGVSAG